MASLREVVTGSDACTPGDGAGPSNAMGTLADALLGGRGKQQQQLHELPGIGGAGPSYSTAPFQPPTAAQAAEAALHGALPAVPGMAPGINADVEAFLRSREQQGHPGLASGDLIPDFDAIFSAAAAGPMAAPPSFSGAAPVHAAVLPFLQAFFHSGSMRPGMTAGPLPPGMELSVPDKCRVRDRSTILARQVFADRGAAFADQQVGHLLHSLNIDPAALPGGVAADGAAWDRIFHANGPAVAAENAASAAMAHAAGPSGAWATEFASLSLDGPQQAGARPQPEAWAQEFEQTKGSSWADEFREAALAGSAIRDQRQDAGAALEQTKKLAETLAANKDPKFQNSQFLQFVSKMSRGELILEDNQVKEVSPEVAAWADEFMASRGAVADVPASWEKEFAAAQAPGTDWAAEFADKLTGGGAWAEEFAGSAAQWEDEYLAELERLHSAAGPRASGDYVMSENNPFLTDTESFAKGKELFRRGVLTEAVLALEAECQRNPGNAEAWRLLGTVQAENDDDVQAIAALNRALAADPNDLDALLSLGVSHTNELEQELALSHLREWIMKHPQHAAEARQAPGPPDSSQAMLYVTRLYEAAAASSPQDADVHAALGVLRNLGRRHDAAVAAFRAALALRPQDYSLWNKLGATLANSGRSGEALQAYQKALELKPNYMRAWTNMGISLANLGEYEDSARYYVRALALNRKAAAVWGYLRTSLSCAAREDLLEFATQENLEALQNALTL